MKKASRYTGRGGRPPKFHEPSRPITLTLPLRTLSQLESIGADRAKAIVRTVDKVAGASLEHVKDIDIVPIGRDASLIVTGPCKALKRVQGVRSVEVAPGRFILTVPTGTSPSQTEVAIGDVLESLSPGDVRDRKILEELITIFRHSRRTHKMTKEEILIIGRE